MYENLRVYFLFYKKFDFYHGLKFSLINCDKVNKNKKMFRNNNELFSFFLLKKTAFI